MKKLSRALKLLLYSKISIKRQEDLSLTKKYMPFLLATAIFMEMLDATILNTTLPAIAKDINESTLNMQSAIVTYVLTLALFIPISGYLADKYGTRITFILSIAIFGMGSLLCSLSTNLIELDIARIIQGAGGALMTPVGRLAMIKLYPKNELVSAMNYAIIPALLGPLLGPLIGGYIVEFLAWHWIFLINIPLAIIGILFSLKYMPDYKEDNPKLDLWGFGIFSTASILLSIGLEFADHSSNYLYVVVLMLIGIFMLYVYYIHAKAKKEEALFPLSLFSVRTFRIGIIGNLVTRLGLSAIPIMIPLFIQLAYGKSASTSGWLIAPMAIALMITKPFVLRVISFFGYKKTLIINTVCLGLLILAISFSTKTMSVLYLVPAIFMLGCFNSVQFTAMNSISVSDLDDNQKSSGNSLLTMNQQLSMGFGTAIGLSVLKWMQGAESLTGADIHKSFIYTFIFLAILTILSSVVFKYLDKNDGRSMLLPKKSSNS